MKTEETTKTSPELLAHRGAILSYHRIAPADLDPWGLRVSPQRFAEQLAVLREIGDPVPLHAFSEPQALRGRSRPAIAITFDDAYVDNLVEALPLLQQAQTPATVFVPTAYIGKEYFWWEVLESVFLQPGRLPTLLTLSLESQEISWSLDDAAFYRQEQYAADRNFCKWRGEPGSRVRLYHDVYGTLWSLSHTERLRAVAAILRWSGIDFRELAAARPMTASELESMGSDELIDLGGHTINHLPLDEMSLLVQQEEVVGCREGLEGLLNRPVRTFAYPHGKYTDETITVLRDAGYEAACTTRQAVVSESIDPMALPRFTIKNWSGREFKDRISAWLSV